MPRTCFANCPGLNRVILEGSFRSCGMSEALLLSFSLSAVPDLLPSAPAGRCNAPPWLASTPDILLESG
eukprot:3350080-Rhodomonas_salina.1